MTELTGPNPFCGNRSEQSMTAARACDLRVGDRFVSHKDLSVLTVSWVAESVTCDGDVIDGYAVMLTAAETGDRRYLYGPDDFVAVIGG